MKDTSRSVSRIAAPVRGVAQRFAYMALIVAAVALMLLGKVDVVIVETVRSHVTDAVAPILDGMSRPVESVNTAVQNVREIFNIRDENARLREANARLLQWQTVARQLETENQRLRGLLDFKPDPEARDISARVIADTGGAFAHSLILNAGDRQGVRKGQAAVTGEGLVGRVAGVGGNSSRLLLITDLNSRIPVITEPGRTRAIMAGNNADQPRLIHLPPGAAIQRGDRVVTSGHGGAFPPGLPVGVVSEVGEGGIRVQPFVERGRLSFVRILDFGLKGIVQVPSSDRPAKRTRP